MLRAGVHANPSHTYRLSRACRRVAFSVLAPIEVMQMGVQWQADFINMQEQLFALVQKRRYTEALGGAPFGMHANVSLTQYAASIGLSPLEVLRSRSAWADFVNTSRVSPQTQFAASDIAAVACIVDQCTGNSSAACLEGTHSRWPGVGSHGGRLSSGASPHVSQPNALHVQCSK